MTSTHYQKNVWHFIIFLPEVKPQPKPRRRTKKKIDEKKKLSHTPKISTLPLDTVCMITLCG